MKQETKKREKNSMIEENDIFDEDLEDDLDDDLEDDIDEELDLKLDLNVTIDNPNWIDGLDFEVIEVAKLAHQITFDYVAMIEEHLLLLLDKRFELNLCLSDNQEVQRLNKEFRGKDKPTNVLSFANIDDDDFDDMVDNHNEVELGDIIIAFETIKQEAIEKGISFEAHYTHILVHGYLHLLGYDHQDEEEAEQMEEIEVNILSLLEVSDPYADD